MKKVVGVPCVLGGGEAEQEQRTGHMFKPQLRDDSQRLTNITEYQHCDASLGVEALAAKKLSCTRHARCCTKVERRGGVGG